MVDLSKATPGMIAKFRCGGEAVIDHLNIANTDVFVKFATKYMSNHGTSYTNLSYNKDGSLQHAPSGPLTVFDIIALEQPAFDWKDVKPGMAFVYHDNKDLDIWLYSGPCLQNKNFEGKWEFSGYANFQHKDNPSSGDNFLKLHMVRRPEHDVEVA